MRRIQAAILLFLFSSTLFAKNVELHYCHGELTDIALIGTTSCACPEFEDAHDHQIEKKTSCCPHEKKEAEKKPLKVVTNDDDCCETKVVAGESHEVLLTQSTNLSDDKMAFPLAVSFITDQSLQEKKLFFNSYDPPNLQKDIILLLQTFLI